LKEAASKMVKIVGHRGAPALVAENTIESFKKAIESGADYIECDLDLSRDGRIVVMHDDTVDRTTNGRGFVRDLTLAELTALTIPGGFNIPTIEEVLELGFPVMMDLKSYGKDDSHQPQDRLATKLLQTLNEVRPKQEIILLSTGRDYSDELARTGYKRINLLPDFRGLDAVDQSGLFGIGVFYRHLSAALVAEAHAKHLEVYSWPPDRKEDVERAIGLGLDFLLSNDPGYAAEVARHLRRTDEP